MATTSLFDPDKVDPEFYSKDPNQHGDSDYGRESEGVGTNEFYSTSGMDMEAGNMQMTHDSREANVGEFGDNAPKGESLSTTQEWEVDPAAVNDSDQPKGHMMSDEAADKLNQLAENPSDDALFHRGDATYLEDSDTPGEGYDPHNKGYDGKDKVDVQ